MLSVKGVHKKFEGEKNKWALRGINFNAQAGQHIFIIGETGSGKSTLLKCIYGLYDLDKGKISWEKKRIQGPSEQLIAGNESIRLVEQEYKLSLYKTVEANLLEVLPFGLFKKEQHKRVNDMLSLFNLERLGKRKPDELSGGQQQRVAIAKAFIDLPKVLLLDEPFAHFDPQMRNKVFEFLRDRINNKGLLVITVTHDFNETLKNADHVLVLEKGKVIQSGTSINLYQNPNNLYVAGLLGEYNEIEIGKKLLFIRPEQILISSKGKYEATVINKRFCGHFQEVLLQFGHNEITSFVPHHVEIEMGGMLKFDMPTNTAVVLPNGELQ